MGVLDSLAAFTWGDVPPELQTAVVTAVLAVLAYLARVARKVAKIIDAKLDAIAEKAAHAVDRAETAAVAASRVASTTEAIYEAVNQRSPADGTLSDQVKRIEQKVDGLADQLADHTDADTRNFAALNAAIHETLELPPAEPPPAA